MVHIPLTNVFLSSSDFKISLLVVVVAIFIYWKYGKILIPIVKAHWFKIVIVLLGLLLTVQVYKIQHNLKEIRDIVTGLDITLNE